MGPVLPQCLQCSQLRSACLSIREARPTCSRSCAQRSFRIDVYGAHAEADVAVTIDQRRCIPDPLNSFRLRHLEQDIFVAARNESPPAQSSGRALHLIWPRFEKGHGDVVMYTLLPIGCELYRAEREPTSPARDMMGLGVSGVRYAQILEPLRGQHPLCTLERKVNGLPRCAPACYDAIWICEPGRVLRSESRRAADGRAYQTVRRCGHNQISGIAAWHGAAALAGRLGFDTPSIWRRGAFSERGVLRVLFARRVGRRILLNLDDLLGRCSSLVWGGWRLECKACVMRDLTPQALVRAMRAADVYVAMHGGDVIHGIHMLAGRTVIELLNFEFREARWDWRNQHMDMLTPALRFRRIVLPAPNQTAGPSRRRTGDWGNPAVFKSTLSSWNRDAQLPWPALERALRCTIAAPMAREAKHRREDASRCRGHRCRHVGSHGLTSLPTDRVPSQATLNGSLGAQTRADAITDAMWSSFVAGPCADEARESKAS